MARQGHSFVTAQNVRVVYPPRHDDDQELVDVPNDGSTVGEIVTRGNIVMKEVGDAIRQVSRPHQSCTVSQYFKDPEATRKAFRGGYFNSGDLAVMHTSGVVQIMDRKKDIIISGGEVSAVASIL